MAAAASLLLAQAGFAQVACTSNCAQVTVTGGTGSVGNTMTVGVSYTQGPNDGVADQGNDETAALAFTLGIPGTGSSTPLMLADCSDSGDGLTPAIHVADAIKSNFKVVVENLRCTTSNGTPRTRCLCPDAGQTRDNFINVVVYGPKDLPATGPVTIPVLPSGSLLTIDLTPVAGGTIPLHVFSEVDSQSQSPKPQFGAFLSIGDVSAKDQTFDRTQQPEVSKVAITNATANIPVACVGDCNGDGTVTVDELVKGVNISLNPALLNTCTAFDRDSSNTVTVDELTAGVNNALNGCPP
jgi:hypothetical protein